MKYYVKVIGTKGHLVGPKYTIFGFESKIKTHFKWHDLSDDDKILTEEIITFFKKKFKEEINPLVENIYIESLMPAYWGFHNEYLNKGLEIPEQYLEAFERSKKELRELS